MPNSRSLRVCVLTAAYPAPSDPTRAIFVENLVRGLLAEGIEPTVVAPRVQPAVDPAREERHGIVVERFSYPSRGLRLKEREKLSPLTLAAYVGSALRRTWSAARRSRAHVIYAHWIVPAGFIGALTATARGLPLVLHAHGSDVNRFAVRSALTRLLSRWTLRKARRVLGVSNDLVSRMGEGLGLEADRAAVVPMGADGVLFYPGGRDAARRELGWDESRLRILFVGDLEIDKGIEPLARELVADAGLREGASLTIVGDGLLRNRLEALAAKAPQTLTLLGRQEQDAVARTCRACDLLVLPSRGEGMPLAVTEALCCGTPVLATPVGGLPERIVEGENGWLRGAEGFIPKLRDLLDSPQTLSAMREKIAASPSRGELLVARVAPAVADVLREFANREIDSSVESPVASEGEP